MEEWGERILVGIDARNGFVSSDGWTETSVLQVETLAYRFEKIGIGGIIYTDIARDGQLRGPNLRAMCELAQNVTLPIIASGGVSKIEDLIALSSCEKSNLIGAIVGKALYEGRFRLKDAFKQLRALSG